jgi:hypothetical protein
LDIELIVDGLNHRGKTIGGTRSTGHELHIRGVLVLVDTHDNSRRIILGRGREDDLLGTRFDMWLARFGGKEGTGRLAKVVHTKTSTPLICNSSPVLLVPPMVLPLWLRPSTISSISKRPL